MDWKGQHSSMASFKDSFNAFFVDFICSSLAGQVACLVQRGSRRAEVRLANQVLFQNDDLFQEPSQLRFLKGTSATLAGRSTHA